VPSELLAPLTAGLRTHLTQGLCFVNHPSMRAP